MDPYLATALAMCAIVFIALAGTAWLAVYFNRRAKADLERLLTPLAEIVGGSVNVDDAEVRGSYCRNLVMARMANAAAGTVRLFRIDMIDAAGGEPWSFLWTRPRKGATAPRVEFTSEHPEVRHHLELLREEALAPLKPLASDWIHLEYNPEAGHVRFERPMRSRNEIPDPETFRAQLDYLCALADANRALQEQLRAGQKDVVP